MLSPSGEILQSCTKGRRELQFQSITLVSILYRKVGGQLLTVDLTGILLLLPDPKPIALQAASDLWGELMMTYGKGAPQSECGSEVIGLQPIGSLSCEGHLLRTAAVPYAEGGGIEMPAEELLSGERIGEPEGGEEHINGARPTIDGSVVLGGEVVVADGEDVLEIELLPILLIG